MRLQCNYKCFVYLFALLSVSIGIVYYGQVENRSK